MYLVYINAFLQLTHAMTNEYDLYEFLCTILLLHYITLEIYHNYLCKPFSSIISTSQITFNVNNIFQYKFFLIIIMVLKLCVKQIYFIFYIFQIDGFNPFV